jgi:hypothetical protein
MMFRKGIAVQLVVRSKQRRTHDLQGSSAISSNAPNNRTCSRDRSTSGQEVNSSRKGLWGVESRYIGDWLAREFLANLKAVSGDSLRRRLWWLGARIIQSNGDQSSGRGP